MLEAKKSKWFEEIYAIYNRNLFRRKFNSLQVCGLQNLRQPLLIYANHSGWWDGLVAFEICRKAKLDIFIMMEEKQLKNLQFFRKLGAFSVVREKPRQAIKSLNYAANLLKEQTDRTVWIFPQGEILPDDLRPIKFFNGVSKIIENNENCNAVPLAIRYEFLGNFKPDIFVKIGNTEQIKAAKSFNRRELTQQFANNLTATLDELKSDIMFNNFSNYQNII